VLSNLVWTAASLLRQVEHLAAKIAAFHSVREAELREKVEHQRRLTRKVPCTPQNLVAASHRCTNPTLSHTERTSTSNVPSELTALRGSQVRRCNMSQHVPTCRNMLQHVDSRQILGCALSHAWSLAGAQ
jgi:hypothetical protein